MGPENLHFCKLPWVVLTKATFREPVNNVMYLPTPRQLDMVILRGGAGVVLV